MTDALPATLMADTAADPAPDPARVARMLALAHRLQAAIDRGEYRDRAELARQLGLTRARISQLLALTLLAPDLQEHVLFLEAVDGREPLTERALREVVRHEGWAEQGVAWLLAAQQRRAAEVTHR